MHIYTQDMHGHIHTCTYTQIHADTYTQSTCVCQQKYIKIYLTTFSTLKVNTNIDFIHKRYLTDVLPQQDMLAPWWQNSVVTFSRKKKRKILSKASSHSFCVSSSASEDPTQLNPPERLPLSPGFAVVIFH